ncbi:Chondroitin polymerase [Chryseobacterium nakagawai]|uniref:Glycosyltransferase n=1 Tax=Chryseobacterium nakagawai TaxID=1241982 RepID=A0AAD0YK37_CHRNA|nr:glycosyltransferase [Chryseobacterium nakagawai]AZA91282.1 glycosyltransferase [Chryseobacterium nakagawai]VEH22851.1 Chondroitin polymerase [Chryseobacterium nakagawai]
MKTSVALCTYNGEKYLKEQLDSIINQTYKIDEIIVCDDQSTDTTLSILKEYDSLFPGLFHIYVNEQNLKSVKNFEKAISLCNNDIIFLSDQDDLWKENKVESIVSYFRNNPDTNVISTNGCCLLNNEIDCNRISVWDIPNVLNEEKIKYDYFEIISSITNIATGATMAIRKNFIPQFFPIPVYNDFHHDEWISLVSSYHSSFSFHNEKLTYYRIHEDQQVGLNFFKLSIANLKALTAVYRRSKFDEYKRAIKVTINNYNKKKAILQSNTLKKEFVDILEKGLSVDLEKIEQLSRKTKKEFPFQYILLMISNIFTNKRTINQ